MSAFPEGADVTEVARSIKPAMEIIDGYVGNVGAFGEASQEMAQGFRE